MKYIKRVLIIALAVLVSASLWIPVFGYSFNQPRPSVIALDAVPVGETFSCSFVIYSENGFHVLFELREDNIEIKGSGKADIISVDTMSNTGQTVSGTITLKGTYPGEIKIAIKNDSFCDNAGIYNVGSVPANVDLKIFNIDGENRNKKMTDFEEYLTYFIAPFWSLFNLTNTLFN